MCYIGGWIDFLFIIFQFISQYFSHKTLIGDITSNLICNDTKISYYNNNKISKSQNNSLRNNLFFSGKINKEQIMNFKKIYTLKSNSILSLKEKIMNIDKKNY